MFGESIGSSPKKGNRSIHKVRLQRRSQRKNLEESMQATLLNSSADSVNQLVGAKESPQRRLAAPTLRDLYEAADDDELVRTLCPQPNTERCDNKNFDPFAQHKLLTLGDRVEQPRCRNLKGQPSQGFRQCDKIVHWSEELKATEIMPESNATRPAVVAPDATIQLGITESELLHFCDETEERIHGKSTTKVPAAEPVQTPNTSRAKSIVEMILEDFNSSPASPELRLSEESPCVFKFANQPLRTYDRRQRRATVTARQNIGTLLESVAGAPIEDAQLSDSSLSGLSVQEDQTQAPAFTTENLHTSQTLCENLHNLSAYFTQISGGSTVEQQPLQEATSLELYVTAVEEQQKSESNTTNALPVGRQVLEDYNADKQSSAAVSDSPRTASIAQNCDIKAAETPSQMQQTDNENIFDDDEWNDECDFFVNFNTPTLVKTAEKPTKLQLNVEQPVANSSTTEIAAPNFAIGSRTASIKTIPILNEAHVRAATILEELTDFAVLEDPEDCESISNNMQNSDKGCKLTTAVDDRNEPSTSKIAGGTHAAHDCYVKASTVSNSTTSADLCVGFRTASSKTITISKEAQVRAAKILEELPDLTVTEGKAASKTSTEVHSCNNSAQNSISKTVSVDSSHEFVGFRTASSKSIKISKEAQERAAKILNELLEPPSIFQDNNHQLPAEENLGNMQFSEWNLDEFTKNTPTWQQENVAPVTSLSGFCTASKKSIQISEDAKGRAAKILAELPELPKIKMAGNIVNTPPKTVVNGMTETLPEELMDVVFSEWPLQDEEVPAYNAPAKVEQNALGAASKRKREGSSIAPEADRFAPVKAVKVPCKLESADTPRSPLNGIGNATVHKSLSDLAVHTPLTSNISRAVVSRRNLLSLSRRNKSTRRPSNDKCSEVETPTKDSRTGCVEGQASCSYNAQTPPDTPMPNLNEFFNSVAHNTSTPHTEPRSMRARLRKGALTRADQLPSVVAAAMDFKPIEWEPENEPKHNASSDSITKTPCKNTSKLSSSSYGNITLTESNPTPKQRIERLRMYGKPPNVSPICIADKDNCRPSGLRRRSSRNLVKQ